jgi:6,7-dimethyl-8-ribityllumazine synthase
MLKESKDLSPQQGNARIAIVASTYNAEYVDGMLDAALATLTDAGVGKAELVRVPGAFEIPVVTAKLARRKRRRPEAIICLGVILRGETTHANNVGETVSRLLGEIAVETSVPVIHEVLLLENETQAKARCTSKKTNRGAEAAHSALAMARLISRVS